MLFRQNQRNKPEKTGEHQVIAMAYWSVRALNPPAQDRAALRRARGMFPEMILSDATIRKIAQRHREVALGILKFGGRIKPLKMKSGRIVYLRNEQQIQVLREYLRKKSARVDE